MIINPYKKGSRSAKNLKVMLNLNGIKTLISDKPPRDGALILNWGNSTWTYPPDPGRYTIINPALEVGQMTNKLRFFQHVGHDKTVPEWTTDPVEALDWKVKVVARQKLEASGGAGIVIWEPLEKKADEWDKFPRAPLYVKYENKTHEYRIHMARGLRGVGFYPLLVQRKIFVKSAETPQPLSWEIRNHSNGFVFVQASGYPTPECVLTLAKEFMEKHFAGMHFAALDIIFHEKKNKCWVLEGNTAPGLEGNTLEVYRDYFTSLAKEAA